MEILKEYYKSPDDIELLAGVWMERPVDGGLAPPTFYCLMVEQLLRSIKSDRHWYERPNVFTWRKYNKLKLVRGVEIEGTKTLINCSRR